MLAYGEVEIPEAAKADATLLIPRAGSIVPAQTSAFASAHLVHLLISETNLPVNHYRKFFISALAHCDVYIISALVVY
jgi:hypothetical protein